MGDKMNYIGTKLIETERLILRKFKTTDYENMFKNCGSDPKVTRFVAWETHKTIKDSEEIIDKWILEYEDNKTYNWAIELKETNEVIGNISIVKLEDRHSSCEIGYCIGSEFWNQGIVTEAFKAVIKFLFEEVGFNRICAKYNTVNKASGRVMEKCNMTYEGTLREAKYGKNGVYSLGVYSILRSEWIKYRSIQN